LQYFAPGWLITAAGIRPARNLMQQIGCSASSHHAIGNLVGQLFVGIAHTAHTARHVYMGQFVDLCMGGFMGCG
jgi:hypothetical protein